MKWVLWWLDSKKPMKAFVVMWFHGNQRSKVTRQIKLVEHVEGRYIHLNVQHDPLILLDMDSPDTVLAFIVGFRPVRRQHHSSWICDLTTTHSWKMHTYTTIHIKTGNAECTYSSFYQHTYSNKFLCQYQNYAKLYCRKYRCFFYRFNILKC